MKRTVPPQIFDYTDYRKFLTDLFSWEKGKRPRFSLRAFCAKVSPGLATSSFLSAVLRGKKNIGPSLRARFAHAMGLKVREGKYFDLLVQFNQAKEIREKSTLFAQLSRFNHTRARIVYENQFRFFTQWYHPVIWNYFGIQQSVKGPAEIAAHIQPALTASQVQESIRLLLELGLIKKLANGYSVTENHLSTEPEFKGMEAIPFCEMSLTLAREALHAVAPEHRKFGTLIFSASRTTVDLIQEKLTALQEEIEELIDKDHHPDGVYSYSYQVFPNTKPRNSASHARAGGKPR